MALQLQNVPISLAQGLDTKTDPKQVIPGKLITLENGIFTSLNRIKKRNGYAVLSNIIEGGVTTISSGLGLSTYKNELNLFSGSNMYSYSVSTERWSDKGKISSISLSSTPIVRNTYQQTVCDVAYHEAGIELYTWEDSRGGSRYSIKDSTTGETLVADALINASAIKPKPFALGNYLFILYINSSLNQLKLLPFAIIQPTIPLAEQTIALNVDTTNPNFDATKSDTRIYLAYNTSAVGGSISLRSIDAFLTISVPRDIVGENADSCIGVAIDPANTNFWVAYHNGTQIKYFIYDQFLSLTPVLAPTLAESNSNTINNLSIIITNNEADIYYTQNAAATYNNFIKTFHSTSAGVTTGIHVYLRSVGITAKPFKYNDIVYLTVGFSTTLQPTYFITDTTNATVVAKFSPNNGGGLLAKNIVPEVVATTTAKFLIPSLQKSLFTTVSGAIYTQTGVTSIELDFAAFGTFGTAELAENSHITGGMLFMYDGISAVEHGFHIFPENVTSTTTTGSGSIAAGTYQYVVTYEWMDNQGQTHYSAPSPAITQVTSTPSSTNTLTIPTLRLTDKKSPRGSVIIGVYRTEADGETFYKVSSVTSPLLNNTTVDTVTFVDTQADAAIIGNPLLYTTGGVLENISAPATNFVTVFKNRIILLPSENSNQFWYSKTVVPGVPVEFSDALVQNIDASGGPLVAAARLDSLLILLKEENLFYITGSGPDSTGAQNDFSEAQPIVSDGGCVNKKSVILTPAGLMYKSQKGIYLLDRRLETKYIGADVEAYNSATIVSANLIDDTQQVRFCLDTGVALVYDYYVNQWAVFTNHSATDAVSFQNKFTYVKSNGIVFQETPGAYTDDGTFIKLKIKTAWLSFAGLQSFQRVRKLMLLGEYISPHNLQVSVAYDFNPYATQISLIRAGELLETPKYGDDATYGESSPYGGKFPQYQFYSKLNRQKCETIQITIEDIQQGASFGEDVAFSALAFEVGVKKGLDKLPATNSFN